MTRPLRLPLVLSIALVAALGGAALGTTTDPSKAPVQKTISLNAPRTRTVSFIYEAGYTFPPPDHENYDVWVPVPLDGESQKISDMVIYAPAGNGVDAEPENGNRLFHVHTGPRGGVALQVRIKFNVTRTETLNPDLTAKPSKPATSPPNLQRYLKGDRLVPLGPKTKSLAATITKGKTTTIQKARAIYDYVIANMKFDSRGEAFGRGDLEYALSAKSGNSIDFNALFEGLARASGIPSRLVTGFKIPRGPKDGSLSESHCWSEFYLSGTGWIPVDPVDGLANPSRRDFYFGNLDSDRIAFGLGRDVVLKPPQKGEPINFWLYPYAEVDGKPQTGATYRFMWTEGAAPGFERVETPATQP